MSCLHWPKNVFGGSLLPELHDARPRFVGMKQVMKTVSSAIPNLVTLEPAFVDWSRHLYAISSRVNYQIYLVSQILLQMNGYGAHFVCL